MKVRHFDTAFRASLLLFVAFSSSVALSDGTCYLTQYPSGEYVIRCEGDGVWINYVDHTNEVYIIENCETLKANLLSAVYDIDHSLISSISTAQQIYDVSTHMFGELTEDNIDLAFELSIIQSDSDQIKQELTLSREVLVTSTNSLYSQIQDIQCGSCSTDSGGGGSSCCDVDLTPVLWQLNMANNTLGVITNALLGTRTALVNRIQYKASLSGGAFIANKYAYFPNTSGDISFRNMIYNIGATLADASSSLNNYLYSINQFQLKSISNNVEIVMSTTTNFYNAATNHFSFFRSMTFQDSPLIDYSQQSTFDSYYDFLTNHYVKVSFKQYNSLVGDEKAKTNWFSRIETLLAALVFNDSDGTNTVDDAYGQDQQNNLVNSLDGMNQTSTTQVNLMSSMGDNLLASLRSLNSSFSSAVSMPGEVKLVTVGQDNSIQSNIIKFQSSEISQLVEACRCATTLAWCFGGIWLLFLFVSWSVKASYSLCVFCWSVVSAIFGGGKT